MLINSPKELALFVMNWRKKMKLTQSDVGKMVGLKQQTISEFERRPESTRIDTLFRILSALKLETQLSARNKSHTSESQWKEQW